MLYWKIKNWFREKVLGKKYYYSVDYGYVGGDKTCVVEGFKNRKGEIKLTRYHLIENSAMKIQFPKL